jgi:hypothetical protein
MEKRISIPESEYNELMYNKLKGNRVQTKRIITFPEGSSAGFDEWEIIQSSDGHDYLENNGGSDQILMHYIECNKCKKK